MARAERYVQPTLALLMPPAGVRRRLPPHPGPFLERHYLAPLAMTQTEAARRLGVSRRRINELVQGRRAMSPDTAIRCAIAFGLPAADWLALQADWDCHQAWRTLRLGVRAGR
jgi:addiction module HigA family antidote